MQRSGKDFTIVKLLPSGVYQVQHTDALLDTSHDMLTVALTSAACLGMLQPQIICVCSTSCLCHLNACLPSSCDASAACHTGMDLTQAHLMKR